MEQIILIGRKHRGKRRNCSLRAISPFPTGFSKGLFSRGIKRWEWVNRFPNKPWFLRVCSTSLLKTLGEKEKLLVTSNFSFSHSVSTLLENFLPFSLNLKLSSANAFRLEESEICRLRPVYTFTIFGYGAVTILHDL